MHTDKQRLQQLLNKEAWSSDDREWLLAYLENTGNTELEALMAALYERDLAAGGSLEGEVSSLMRQHIAARTGIHMAPRNHPSIIRRLSWWAAAAVLLFLAAGSWYFINRRPAVPAVAVHQQDILPGRNRATLTISDGRTIDLDSAAKGQLVLQGNTEVMKADSGLLTYRFDETASQKTPGKTTVSYNMITTPRGGQYQVVLPDGTKVWLNAASSLRFPTSFSGKERLVQLQGEAYFEVVSGYTPFTVQVPPSNRNAGADPLNIEVLGTHFNVNAYDDEPAARATLLEGRIRVRKGAGSQLLKAGQQAIADNGSPRIEVSNDADLDEAIAWKNGLFVFNSLPLEAIMRQMERWYDVEVSYEGNVKEISFNGQISRYSNASKMLDMLATTGEVHFTLENKKIIVRP